MAKEAADTTPGSNNCSAVWNYMLNKFMFVEGNASENVHGLWLYMDTRYEGPEHDASRTEPKKPHISLSPPHSRAHVRWLVDWLYEVGGGVESIDPSWWYWFLSVRITKYNTQTNKQLNQTYKLKSKLSVIHNELKVKK